MSKLKKYKIKTKKIVQKRFKVTGSGKIMHLQSETSHLKEKQSSRVKRRKSKEAQLTPVNEKKIKRLLPYWKKM